MNGFEGHPLFERYSAFDYMREHGTRYYPTLARFLDAMPEGAHRDWRCGVALLSDSMAKRTTFGRYRGELQRFMLFVWLRREKCLLDAGRDDIEAYIHFVASPPSTWIAPSVRSFRYYGPVRAPLGRWRPFEDKAPGMSAVANERLHTLVWMLMTRIQEHARL